MSDEQNFKYLLDGTVVEIVQKLNDGRWLVQELYECEEHFKFGDPIVVDHVFASPPTKVLDERVSELNKKIKALEEQLIEMEMNVKSAKLRDRNA